MKAELKTLSKEHADVVAAHLLAAASLVDEDPELAFRHAEAAKRRAARLPVVREAVAETAYAAGRFEDALSEFRALRRMNGSADYLPVLADCERALGRHQAALRLVAEGEQSIKDPALQVELRIVQAGVRADMGQREEALRLLRSEIESPRVQAPRDAQARLKYAYADLLLAGGDEVGAREWFIAAVRLDPEGQTDALDRLDELDGMVLTLDEDDLDDDEDRAQKEAQEATLLDEEGTDTDDSGGAESKPDSALDASDADTGGHTEAPDSADSGADEADAEASDEVEPPAQDVRGSNGAELPVDKSFESAGEGAGPTGEPASLQGNELVAEKPKRVRKAKGDSGDPAELSEGEQVADPAGSGEPVIEKPKRVRKVKGDSVGPTGPSEGEAVADPAALAEAGAQAAEGDEPVDVVAKPKRVRKAKPVE